jgi:hypothetical protein
VSRIAITGHRVLNRNTTRLVRRGVERALAGESPPLLGLTCLADGSDQIFAELVVEAGGSIEAFIAGERFADTLSTESRRRYRSLRACCGAVHTVRCEYPCAESYMQASRLMVDRADVLWAVWDGQAARGYGGTADVVAYARKRAVPVKVIWPAGAIYQTAVNWRTPQQSANL